jgi:hypothetical protein
MPGVKPSAVVEAFLAYMKYENHEITAKRFEENFASKMIDRSFLTDIRPLLAAGTVYDPVVAAELVSDQLIAKLD